MISKAGKTRLVTLGLVMLSLFRALLFDIAPKCLPLGIVFISSCADERPPTGGKKDTVLPKVKFAYPANKSLNFHGHKLKIRFEKYIQQSVDPKEIIVSPPMDQNPKMIVNGKNLVVTIPGKLKDNTTYTINFGDGVKDNNEGYVLKNFTYVFATGNVLDTARLSGYVADFSEKGDLENIMVGLYPIDSIDGVLRSKPYYFAKADKSGNFNINNIHTGSYRVYALKDQNLNYIYDQSSELIGFGDSIISLTDSSRLRTSLVIFESINSRPKLSDGVSIKPGKAQLNYNAPFKTLKFNSDALAKGDRLEINERKDTIVYWYSNPYIEKMSIQLSANDTLLDSLRLECKKLNKDSLNNYLKYPLSFDLQENRRDTNSKILVNKPLLSPFKSIILDLSRPVDSINENKSLTILDDSTKKMIRANYTLDKNAKRKLSVSFDQKEKTSYTLWLPDSIFRDQWGWWNRKMSYKWNSDAKDNYGNIILSLKFDHPEKYYIFKILDQENKAIETFYYVGNQEKKITIKNIKAGTYHLKAIEDTNQNGEWDTGDFYKKRKPERVIKFKETYELKGSWDLEIEVKI